MDRRDWKAAQTTAMDSREAIKLVYPFKDVWKFELLTRGWYYEKREDHEQQEPG